MPLKGRSSNFAQEFDVFLSPARLLACRAATELGTARRNKTSASSLAYRWRASRFFTERVTECRDQIAVLERRSVGVRTEGATGESRLVLLKA